MSVVSRDKQAPNCALIQCRVWPRKNTIKKIFQNTPDLKLQLKSVKNIYRRVFEYGYEDISFELLRTKHNTLRTSKN